MSKFIKGSVLILGALLLVVTATGCSKGFVSSEKGTAFNPSAVSSPGPINGAVQSNSEGAVTIDVEWVSADATPLVFEVAMNTHSVDLDQYDLRELATLRDDAGNEYRPLSWDSAPGGHHRRGTLTFTAPVSLGQGGVKYMEMVIRGIAGVEERVLRWEL